ncbi:hypothetical protein ACFE04_011308 [Oxalis oulophora]
MLSGPSQICIHFLGSRMFGERNPLSINYIPITFIRAHRDNIPEKIKLYSWEGRVWDVDIVRVRTGGLVFGGPRWLALYNFYNIKMGNIDVFDFMNRIDEARFFLFDQTQCPIHCLPYHPPSPPPTDPSPTTSAFPQASMDMSFSSPFMIIYRWLNDLSLKRCCMLNESAYHATGEPNVVQSPAGSLVAGDDDAGAYSLSEQLSFRFAADDKKFRVLKRPKSGSIACFNSLRIPTVFVRRNINYLQQPSHCVLKIPFVGQIVSVLTWGKREPSSDEGGIVLEVMVFNSDRTLCQPNVHGV